jgi:hypothetical protein
MARGKASAHNPFPRRPKEFITFHGFHKQSDSEQQGGKLQENKSQNHEKAKEVLSYSPSHRRAHAFETDIFLK